MAKNSLGELENAPGAQRREGAHSKRAFVKAASPVLDAKVQQADKLINNATVYSRLAKEAHINAELKRTPSEYRQLSRTSMQSFHQVSDEISELKKAISHNKWGARKDSTIAFFQTLQARVFN
jgi:hypothetical protein